MIGVNFPVKELKTYNCYCSPPGNETSINSLTVFARYDRKTCFVRIKKPLSHFKNLILIIYFYFKEMEGSLFGVDCTKPEPAPNVFLMSVVLFLGTFIVSVILKDFKNSLFFSSKVATTNIPKKKH